MALKCGLVGTGAIGRDHLRRLSSTITGVEVTGVVDIVDGLAGSVVKDLNLAVEVYPSDRELIHSGVDAVFITSSSTAHAETAIRAIEAGKYVFCEKPLATTAEDCLRIIEAEKQYNRRLLQVGFMRRYDKGYVELKEIIDNQVIGKPLTIHCRHFNQSVVENYSTSMLITETLIHEIDVLHWLVNDDYNTVQVLFPTKSSKASSEHIRDPQVAVLTTQSGVVITAEIFVNCQYGYDIHCEVVGEEGMASLPEVPSVRLRKNAASSTSLLVDWKQRFIDAYDVELQHFVDAVIQKGRPEGPSAWDGYIAAITADALVRSQTTGKAEPVVLADKPSFY